ncbi:peroxidase [Kitasatospora sp. MMS16-BH015]|uniref:Dyp-type peroxidase n=1 Tax=Kitasatospora sp. MMS16-BH015 TaxID=2018025 RepID=UPI000CA0BC05|nr:Dyp-type peroxidase [Kitasatospora sp. MMS16-BH015]AUG75779.1 peroxidase [Kitasatospora sp. MMS16-BH015]
MEQVQGEPDPQVVPAPPSRAAVFLVLAVEPGGHRAVREWLAGLGGLVRSLGLRAPEARLSCVAGVGAAVWDELYGGPRPAGLHPFRELRGPRHLAPSTPGDVVLHVRATRMDLCFELATRCTRGLAGAARVVDETHGFAYFDQRDLLGFVDGTENPVGAKAARAVYVGAEDPQYAGGSYLVVQKYLHDLGSWDALTVEQQERVIGRTKLADVELADQAADSHVALNQVEGPDGEEQQILRANMAFGSVGRGEYGTYFAGYCRTPEVTEEMLRRMFLGTAEAAHDRILDFSIAVTGSLFFVPDADFLADPPDPAGASLEAATGDGSLGIGGLKHLLHPAPTETPTEAPIETKAF